MSPLEITLALSLFSNAILALLSIYFKTRKKQLNTIPDYEATQLMHDLTQKGRSYVEVRRIDPGTMFVRSPLDAE